MAGSIKKANHISAADHSITSAIFHRKDAKKCCRYFTAPSHSESSMTCPCAPHRKPAELPGTAVALPWRPPLRRRVRHRGAAGADGGGGAAERHERHLPTAPEHRAELPAGPPHHQVAARRNLPELDAQRHGSVLFLQGQYGNDKVRGQVVCCAYCWYIIIQAASSRFQPGSC